MSDTSNDRPASGATPDPQADASAISLDQLSEAFAALLRTEDASGEPTAAVTDAKVDATNAGEASEEPRCDISPMNILEAMLFVGRPDGEPLAREALAGVMRDVEPAQIDRLVEQLNARYDQHGAPYRIVGRGAGYQLRLRDTYHAVRDRFYGRTRQARLSPAAIEVLAIVAYRQPVTAETVRRLRGTPSGAILSQLVRRQLIALTRDEENPRLCHYRTTDRFLQLFGLSSPDDLPPCEAPEREL